MTITIECENVNIEPDGTVVLVECSDVRDINPSCVDVILQHLDMEDVAKNIGDYEDLISELKQHTDFDPADWATDEQILDQCEMLIPQIVDRFYDKIQEAMINQNKPKSSPVEKLLRIVVNNEN